MSGPCPLEVSSRPEHSGALRTGQDDMKEDAPPFRGLRFVRRSPRGWLRRHPRRVSARRWTGLARGTAAADIFLRHGQPALWGCYDALPQASLKVIHADTPQVQASLRKACCFQNRTAKPQRRKETRVVRSNPARHGRVKPHRIMPHRRIGLILMEERRSPSIKCWT